MDSRDDKKLREKLTPLQYEITQRCGTEPPFRNEYWDNHRAGIYVDVVSGEPLFSSLDKYDSGSGWPSFIRPLENSNLKSRVDSSLGMVRTEVRSSQGDSHLGHVFPDGPAPTGQRYCINSASLRFIPVEKLKDEGYERYLPLFGMGSEEVAILAGGCFWGVEELFRALPGVISTRVGYTGGSTSDPVYEQVKTGRTGHAEAIEIHFDPTKTSYEDLLRYFFRLHDPTTRNRQGGDIGTQYRSAIFFTTEVQKASAEKILQEVDRSGKWKHPIVTEITQAAPFYSAEEYHQKYLEKNPGGYTCHFVRD